MNLVVSILILELTVGHFRKSKLVKQPQKFVLLLNLTFIIIEYHLLCHAMSSLGKLCS